MTRRTQLYSYVLVVYRVDLDDDSPQVCLRTSETLPSAKSPNCLMLLTCTLDVGVLL